MDPHKVPPQGLKDIFKELRSIKDKDEPRIATHPVLDFGIDASTDSGENVHFFKTTFDCFHSQTSVIEPPMLGNLTFPAKSYTVDSIHGVTIFPGILSPLSQRTLLDKLLHRDLSNPKHRTNLHLHYDVSYPDHGKSFFTAAQPDVLFQPKDPNVHKELDMRQVLQKKIRWMTLGGQYDWTNKAYPAEVPPEFPADIANLTRDIFLDIMEPQAAIVNIYSPGDTLSLHRDVSEEVNQPLISISLGCECLFLIAVEDETTETRFKHAIIRLRSGDALVKATPWTANTYPRIFTVTNEARFAWHGVPKILPDTCPSHLESWPNDATPHEPFPLWDGWMKNKRINLNIRQMH